MKLYKVFYFLIIISLQIAAFDHSGCILTPTEGQFFKGKIGVHNNIT